MKLQRYRGGEFLVQSVDPADVVVPEMLSPEQREIARTTQQFVQREVRPAADALEEHDWALSRRLMRQLGDLGLLGTELPEDLGGLGLDKLTTAPIQQELGAQASFSITYGVQTGIAMWPTLYFGTPEQKQKYLPRLAAGEWIAAYSLTEPGSGSDALSARATARLSADGTHYILNGVKQWTTNANLADLYTVFAKIDGQQFSAFLVERTFPGVSVGPEEKKMGLKGSSTAQLILTDAEVPVENLLHFAGRGHHVALNTLNLGRFKLAIGCLGAATNVIGVATRYAQERQQFGRSLSSFHLIQSKLAGMAARTYGLESVIYRLTGLLDEALGDLDLTQDLRESAPTAISEYAIECSIAKVLGSETLDEVVDEGVQIHGGNGFMQGYDVERSYRDSRINRIFEGTNEINRLLIPDMLFRRIQRGEIPGVSADALSRDPLGTARSVGRDGKDGPEAAIEAETRRLFWLVAGLAARVDAKAREEEQEVAAALGDLAIDLFAIESTLARAARAQTSERPERAALHQDLARFFVATAFDRVQRQARQAIAYLATDSNRSELVSRLEQAARVGLIDQVSTGRRIAEQVLASRGWPLPVTG